MLSQLLGTLSGVVYRRLDNLPGVLRQRTIQVESGSPTAVALGDELNRCTWTLEWFAYGELAGEADWLLIIREAYLLRKQFSIAARDDLGVAEANLPMPEWRDAWTPRDHMIEVHRRAQALPPP